MLSQILAAATLLAGAVSASPFDMGSNPITQLWSPSAIPDGTKFVLQADDTNNAIRFTMAKAYNRGIYFGGPASYASCPNGDNDDAAVFYIQDGSMYLYTPDGARGLRLWTDRSDSNQGILAYAYVDEVLGETAESQGFAIDATSQLNFDGSGFLACPTPDGSGAWSLWVSAGTDTPQGSQGCIGVLPHGVADSDAKPCTYPYLQG